MAFVARTFRMSSLVGRADQSFDPSIRFSTSIRKARKWRAARFRCETSTVRRPGPSTDIAWSRTSGASIAFTIERQRWPPGEEGYAARPSSASRRAATRRFGRSPRWWRSATSAFPIAHQESERNAGSRPSRSLRILWRSRSSEKDAASLRTLSRRASSRAPGVPSAACHASRSVRTAATFTSGWTAGEARSTPASFVRSPARSAPRSSRQTSFDCSGVHPAVSARRSTRR